MYCCHRNQAAARGRSAMKYVYNVDPYHTTIGFSACHLMVTTIRGKFHEWHGQVEAEATTR
jgi:polyisoprenoid-binding protein YceI